MPYATVTESRYELKEGTSTVWVLSSESSKGITEEHYDNYTSKDTLSFFRRLGGSETATKSCTRKGYLVTKLVSKNPDRTEKVVRTFDF